MGESAYEYSITSTETLRVAGNDEQAEFLNRALIGSYTGRGQCDSELVRKHHCQAGI